MSLDRAAAQILFDSWSIASGLSRLQSSWSACSGSIGGGSHSPSSIAKVAAFFLTLVPASAAAVAALRLLGGRVREPMDNPFAARTPAGFWKRYNRPAQQFFYEDVFKPLGGLRSPARATLGTFAVSAVIHEYIFDITVGRFQGYQTAFFMVQGLAVAATLRVRPQGWRAVAWVAGTVAFNLATSALFFASLNEVLPFYARRWLG